MNTADLDRLDDIAHRAEHGPYESLTALDNEMLRTFPALVAEVRRLRRGVEQLTILLAAHETMPTAHSWDRATECMAHLLAGREWSDNGEGK